MVLSIGGTRIPNSTGVEGRVAVAEALSLGAEWTTFGVRPTGSAPDRDRCRRAGAGGHGGYERVVRAQPVRVDSGGSALPPTFPVVLQRCSGRAEAGRPAPRCGGDQGLLRRAAQQPVADPRDDRPALRLEPGAVQLRRLVPGRLRAAHLPRHLAHGPRLPGRAPPTRARGPRHASSCPRSRRSSRTTRATAPGSTSGSSATPPTATCSSVTTTDTSTVPRPAWRTSPTASGTRRW